VDKTTTLGPDAYAAFEAHALGCPKCLDAVERARRFITAIRVAARRARNDVQIRSWPLQVNAHRILRSGSVDTRSRL